MDTTGPMTSLEAAVTNQLLLAGGDESVEAAANAILTALGPAVRQAVLDLAEQAAAEVGAQLPNHGVEVVIVDGDPSLRVTPTEGGDAVAGDEDYDARISLRLPPSLKHLIEESAGVSGDSVNSWLVKAVSSRVKVRERQAGTRVTGTVDL